MRQGVVQIKSDNNEFVALTFLGNHERSLKMWRFTKPSLGIALVAILFAVVVSAAPQNEPPKSSITTWEYRVMDVAVLQAPISVIDPKATPDELKAAEKELEIQSQLDAEWPRNIPYESVPYFELRLVELGAEGWELVLKDRNMVVFKRPKK